MNEYQYAALERLMGSGIVFSNPVERARASAIIRAADAFGDKSAGIALVRNAMRNWVTYKTTLQRDWQKKPRTVTDRDIRYRCRLWGWDENDPARYSRAAATLRESVSTRDNYVRCN